MTSGEARISVGATQNKGRGVFALTEFAEGEVIEVCPVIVIPANERLALDATVIYNYYFSWGLDRADAAICLGLGSLYNHSFTPNAKYIKNLEKSSIDFVAIRSIDQGEEICVNYNGDPHNTKSLWFEVSSE